VRTLPFGEIGENVLPKAVETYVSPLESLVAGDEPLNRLVGRNAGSPGWRRHN
jgi:hypothetical protein